MSEIHKKVDSEWKKKAEEEKEKLEVKAAEEEAEGELEPVTFLSFLSGLALEAQLALGLLKHPRANEAKQDLVAAQYVIDTIAVLQEKTKGNLTSEEERTLQNLLTELRFRFVQAQPKKA